MPSDWGELTDEEAKSLVEGLNPEGAKALVAYMDCTEKLKVLRSGHMVAIVGHPFCVTISGMREGQDE